MFTDERNASPWILSSLKPIQLSHFDFDGYLEARKKIQTDEWIDLMVQSIGFNPEMLGRRSKFLQLLRLVPYCERNYNIIELGPKGTGKSHIYSEFSPHGILISGGEVTVPKLFVNNSTGKSSPTASPPWMEWQVTKYSCSHSSSVAPKIKWLIVFAAACVGATMM